MGISQRGFRRHQRRSYSFRLARLMTSARPFFTKARKFTSARNLQAENAPPDPYIMDHCQKDTKQESLMRSERSALFAC